MCFCRAYLGPRKRRIKSTSFCEMCLMLSRGHSSLGRRKCQHLAFFAAKLADSPVKSRQWCCRTLQKATFLVVALGILGSANLPVFVRFMENASRECSVTSAMWNTRWTNARCSNMCLDEIPDSFFSFYHNFMCKKELHTVSQDFELQTLSSVQSVYWLCNTLLHNQDCKGATRSKKQPSRASKHRIIVTRIFFCRY